MPRIADLLTSGRTYSFEFFPPQTDAGERLLRDALNELEPLAPSFVSVTYGAGGSTRDRTHTIVTDLLDRTSMTPMAHLTAVGHTRDELAAIIRAYDEAGVQNILALRGDPPRDAPDVGWPDIQHAIELVELVHELTDGRMSVGVAAQPELHQNSPDAAFDRKHLAAKLEAADFGITQLFFSVEHYTRMMDELAALGVDRPVIPGIMPVTLHTQIRRFGELSGATFPEDLLTRLTAAGEDNAEVRRIGTAAATELCQDLLDAGAPGLHYYTLNRSRATREIHAALTLPAD